VLGRKVTVLIFSLHDTTPGIFAGNKTHGGRTRPGRADLLLLLLLLLLTTQTDLRGLAFPQDLRQQQLKQTPALVGLTLIAALTLLGTLSLTLDGAKAGIMTSP